MSSAFYETKGTMRGTAKEMADMAAVLRGCVRGAAEAYFDRVELADEAEGAVAVTADGPYGKYDSLAEVPAFREMAEAAPHAAFEFTVSGSTDMTEDDVTYRLSDGLLHIEAATLNILDDDEAYLNDVLEKMPYDRFIGLYRVDPDTFGEDAYRDFISDLSIDYGTEDSPFSLAYEDFAGELESHGGETALDEETYAEAAAQAEALGIMSFYDDREEHDRTVTGHFVYDPAAGEWQNGTKG